MMIRGLAVSLLAIIATSFPAFADSGRHASQDQGERHSLGSHLASEVVRARVTEWSGDYFSQRYKMRVIDRSYDNYWSTTSWQLRHKGKIIATRGDRSTVYFRLPPGRYTIKKVVRNYYPATDTLDTWDPSDCSIQTPVYLGDFRWSGTVTCGGPNYYATYSGAFSASFNPDCDYYEDDCDYYDDPYRYYDVNNPPAPTVGSMANPEAVSMRLVAHDWRYRSHKTWFIVKAWNYKNVTEREARAIRIGMTKEQVRNIFGTGGEMWFKTASRECRTYDDWVQICYVSGRVAVISK